MRTKVTNIVRIPQVMGRSFWTIGGTSVWRYSGALPFLNNLYRITSLCFERLSCNVSHPKSASIFDMLQSFVPPVIILAASL